MFYREVYGQLRGVEETWIAGFLLNYWIHILIAAVILSLCKTLPKTSVSRKIRDTDVTIRVAVSDIGRCRGALVIPWDCAFRTDLDDPRIDPETIQGQIIRKHFVDRQQHVRESLKQSLSSSGIRLDIHGNYPLESVAVVEIAPDTQFFLIALTQLCANQPLKADPIRVLAATWAAAKKNSTHNQLSIPLIGTGRNRWPLAVTRKAILREIINSFIVASRDERFCERLTICIHWKDYRDISFTEIERFLDHVCTYWNEPLEPYGPERGIAI